MFLLASVFFGDPLLPASSAGSCRASSRSSSSRAGPSSRRSGSRACSSSHIAPDALVTPIHLASYALLFVFAFANVKNLAILPLLLGMALNCIAIVANGGKMPVSPRRGRPSGLDAGEHSNVAARRRRSSRCSATSSRSRAGFPMANVFSIGDILIGIGMIGLMVAVTTGDGSERALVPGRMLAPDARPDLPPPRDRQARLAPRRLAHDRRARRLDLRAEPLDRAGRDPHARPPHPARARRRCCGRAWSTGSRRRGCSPGRDQRGAVVDRRPRRHRRSTSARSRSSPSPCSGLLAAISAATLRSLVPSILRRRRSPRRQRGLGLAQDGAMAIGALARRHRADATRTPTLALARRPRDVRDRRGALLGVANSTVALKPTGRRDGGIVAGVQLRRCGKRLILIVVLAFGAATIATGLTNATLPRFLDGQLGLGPGAYGFGLAALAGGLALGETVIGLRPRRRARAPAGSASRSSSWRRSSVSLALHHARADRAAPPRPASASSTGRPTSSSTRSSSARWTRSTTAACSGSLRVLHHDDDGRRRARAAREQTRGRRRR